MDIYMGYPSISAASIHFSFFCDAKKGGTLQIEFGTGRITGPEARG